MWLDKRPLRQGEGVNRGTINYFDKRLCFQAHDNYFECIDNQHTETPNKFLCMDQLYSYQTYCTLDFIFRRKQRHNREVMDRKLWTQDRLDLINAKGNFGCYSMLSYILYIIIYLPKIAY